MMAKYISVFLLVVGLLWSFIDAGIFALFGGFFGNNPPHDPVLIGKGLLAIWWTWIGPLLMVVGSGLSLRDAHSRGGILSTLIGCVALTITMAYQMFLLWRSVSDPLVAKPTTLYAFDAAVVLVTILADIGAVQLCRLNALNSRTSL
jgi:hypothetical protein